MERLCGAYDGFRQPGRRLPAAVSALTRRHSSRFCMGLPASFFRSGRLLRQYAAGDLEVPVRFANYTPIQNKNNRVPGPASLHAKMAVGSLRYAGGQECTFTLFPAVLLREDVVMRVFARLYGRGQGGDMECRDFVLESATPTPSRL